MNRDPRYDLLFEPIKIGPVTAPNRFYQVPHCSGMGYRYPASEARMRAVKAEGGWGVVSTQECEIHSTTEVGNFNEARLWDDGDIPALAKMAEAVHEHGSLAAIELVYQGHDSANTYSREVSIAPSARPASRLYPAQARAMDKADIKAFRGWHRRAALRARKAGFDLIYVYAGHDLTMLMHFLCRRYNQRTDEYGGSLENRVRLLREVLEDTKEAVGDTCAVPLRIAVEELLGPDGITAAGEGREIVEMLAELPDLWDVNVSDWANDSQTSRFAEEGFQEPHIAFVKKLTSKPVVGVGRFTSPDTMVSQIRRGVLDFIGAARPSIADPFLPKKIEEGRLEAIRECIGCNICVSGDNLGVPMRCTQNPTMGEEWRRGWHPEFIPSKGSDDAVLIVGGGPAGLECARALGQRGYHVTLAEAAAELGGRITRESRLPGLSAWARVRDYRLQQLNDLANVDIYRNSRLGVQEILEFGVPHVVLATGAAWRKDGFGRQNHAPIEGSHLEHVLSPDSVIDGARLTGPVLIFDDDHYYLASVLAEKLRAEGLGVCLVTPAVEVAAWTHNTLEQGAIEGRLRSLDVEIVTRHNVARIDRDAVELNCLITGRRQLREASSVVMVTARTSKDELREGLRKNTQLTENNGIKSIRVIGDANAPSTIAAAVYAGHRYARELDAGPCDEVPYRRERILLED